MSEHVLISLRNSEPAYVDPAAASPGGSWVGPTTISLLVVGVAYASLDNTDYLGYLRSCPANWQNISVANGDQVAINWELPSNQDFDYIQILMQNAASLTYGADCLYKTTGGWRVSGTAASTILVDNISLSTLSGGVPAAYPEISESMIRTPPLWRELAAVAADGVAVPRSHATGTLVDRIGINLESAGISRANYNRLLLWAHRGLRVRLEDSDTDSYIQAWSGLLENTGALQSTRKGDGSPAFSLKVDTEEYY